MKHHSIRYLLFVFFLLALPTGVLSQEEPVGWVTEVSGEVVVINPVDGKRTDVERGTEIYRSHTVETGYSGTVTIELRDGSAIRVDRNSRIKVVDFLYSEEKEVNRSYFRLFQGTVRGILNSLFGKDSEMTIETPTSIAGVKGSDIVVWIENGQTLVALNEGRGFVRHLDERFPEVLWLKPGWMIRVAKGKPPGKPFLIPQHIKKRILKFHIKRHPELIKKLKRLKRVERKRLLERLKKVPKPLRPQIEKNILPPGLKEPHREEKKKRPHRPHREVPPLIPLPPQR